MTSFRKDSVYCKQEIEMSDKNGKYGDSFNSVLGRLLDQVEKESTK